jgi:hypothetical protein
MTRLVWSQKALAFGVFREKKAKAFLLQQKEFKVK